MSLLIFHPWETDKLESVDQYQAHSCLGLLENKPQINADERRFVNLNIQHFSEVYPVNCLIKSPQSTQRAQSSAIPVTTYEKAAPSRLRTRMTRIARIFTDPCVSASSAQSVFYRNPSAFICVHLRLIFVSLSDRTRKIQFKLFRSRVGDGSVMGGILRSGI